MNHLFNMFVKQVEDYCGSLSMPGEFLKSRPSALLLATSTHVVYTNKCKFTETACAVRKLRASCWWLLFVHSGCSLQCVTQQCSKFLRLCSIVDRWMCECGVLVEWYWLGKIDVFEEKPVLLPLCPPQIPLRVAWNWTQDSTLGHWWRIHGMESVCRKPAWFV